MTRIDLMFKRKGRLLILAVAVIAVAAVLVVATGGKGVSTELAVAEQTGLSTSVRGEGQTRVRERFVFTAPVSGQLMRIEAQPGDSIRKGDVLFHILPPPDSRQSLRVAQARLEAARSQVVRLEQLRDDSRAAAELAIRTLERQRVLAEEEILSPQEMEQAELAASSAQRQWDAAESALRGGRAEVRSAEALVLTDDAARLESGVAMRAIEDGILLRIMDRSGRVVMAGEPILETGNLSHLEVVVDVLSEDAVRIRPGNPVVLSGWGADQEVAGRVRYIEPSAFTKWSALGVEEQRVNVVIDLTANLSSERNGGDPQPDAPSSGRLGDGYRVDASIEVWSSDQALTVPVSSVFREGGAWFVFAVTDNKVERREVALGRRSSSRAQVLAGLVEGDEVVRYPTVDISEGVEIQR